MLNNIFARFDICKMYDSFQEEVTVNSCPQFLTVVLALWGLKEDNKFTEYKFATFLIFFSIGVIIK